MLKLAVRRRGDIKFYPTSIMRGAQSKVQQERSTDRKSGAPRLLNTSKAAISEFQPPLLLPLLYSSLWGGPHSVEEFFVRRRNKDDDLSIIAAQKCGCSVQNM